MFYYFVCAGKLDVAFRMYQKGNDGPYRKISLGAKLRQINEIPLFYGKISAEMDQNLNAIVIPIDLSISTKY